MKKGDRIKVNLGYYKNQFGYIIGDAGNGDVGVNMEDGTITAFDPSILSLAPKKSIDS